MNSQLQDQDPKAVHELFTGISHRYDLANRVLSGFMDAHWRRITSKRVAACVSSRTAPTQILDLATGSGELALELQRRIPTAEVTGGDFCVPMLDEARRKGLERLVEVDGMAMPFQDASFDAVTVAFGLRNMADWPGAIREAARVIRPGGTYAILDFSLPSMPFVRPFYRIYLHLILPLIAGALTGRPSAYRYLGKSIEAFPYGRKMIDLLITNGFANATAHPMTFGIVTLYLAKKRPPAG